MASLVNRLGLGRRISPRRPSDLEYWTERTRRMGARAVVHVGHAPHQVAAVTRTQKELLFPLVRQHLRGNERLLLDYGCGPGRFTGDLALLAGCPAVGVDMVPGLLELAPLAPGVEYRLIERGRIPLEDASADVVWIALVLGNITDPQDLWRAVEEIHRVASEDALLFLAENTEPKPDLPHQIYRPVETYRALFSEFAPEEIATYVDMGEMISVLAGRRRPRD